MRRNSIKMLHNGVEGGRDAPVWRNRKGQQQWSKTMYCSYSDSFLSLTPNHLLWVIQRVHGGDGPDMKDPTKTPPTSKEGYSHGRQETQTCVTVKEDRCQVRKRFTLLPLLYQGGCEKRLVGSASPPAVR